MNTYKIGKYIVKADSIHDAVTIVKTIKNSIKDGKYVSELKPGDVITKKDGSKWDVVLVRHTPFGIQVRMNSKISPVKTEEITYRPTDMLAYDSVKDANYQLRYNNGAVADMSYLKLVEETPTQLVFKNLLYTHKDEKFIYVDKKTKVAAYSSGEKIGTMADAVEKTGDSVKDADEYMIEGNIVDKNDPMMTYQAYQNIARKYHLTIKNYTGGMLDLYGSKNDLQRYERDMHMSYSSIEKAHDSVKDARRINYDDDIIEVTLNGKVVFRGYAEDWLDNNFDSNFKWTGSQYEASNAKGKWVVRVIDSFQKDSLTVRDVIQSLINEETSAISSYNVALETLKDHIPDEAYEAIKAIRDDEQRHVENLYAVLNGNVTPKNLEN